MSEAHQYPHLDQYLKSLNFGESFRSWFWTIVFGVVCGIIGGGGLRRFGVPWDPFSMVILILLAGFLVSLVRYFITDRYKEKQNLLTLIERQMPRIVRRALSKGTFTKLVGQEVALQLDEMARSARQAQVALAELQMGQSLPRSYMHTVTETVKAMEATFRRALVCTRKPLVFKVPMGAEEVEQLSAEKDRLETLTREGVGFAKSVVKTAVPPDTAELTQRLRALQDFENSLTDETPAVTNTVKESGEHP